MRQSSLIVLAAVLVMPIGCGRVPSGPPTQRPVAATWLLPPNCAGNGVSAPPGSMSGGEIQLASLINDSRTRQGLKSLPASSIATGVAQWQARDQANNGYLGAVGSDGEDIMTRLVCSGIPGSTDAGVIMVGQTSNVNEVFTSLNNDYSSRLAMYATFYTKSLSVGYNNGYWVIILL